MSICCSLYVCMSICIYAAGVLQQVHGVEGVSAVGGGEEGEDLQVLSSPPHQQELLTPTSHRASRQAQGSPRGQRLSCLGLYNVLFFRDCLHI